MESKSIHVISSKVVHVELLRILQTKTQNASQSKSINYVGRTCRVCALQISPVESESIGVICVQNTTEELYVLQEIHLSRRKGFGLYGAVSAVPRATEQRGAAARRTLHQQLPAGTWQKTRYSTSGRKKQQTNVAGYLGDGVPGTTARKTASHTRHVSRAKL